MLQINIAEIIVHEADEANAFVNFFDAERLPREDGLDIDLLAVQAEATTLWARRLSENRFSSFRADPRIETEGHHLVRPILRMQRAPSS